MGYHVYRSTNLKNSTISFPKKLLDSIDYEAWTEVLGVFSLMRVIASALSVSIVKCRFVHCRLNFRPSSVDTSLASLAFVP
jgi:hypothetical protein